MKTGGSLRTTVALALAALAGGGCTTTPQAERAAERAASFARLPSAQQADISRDLVDQGYSLEMVYIALGRPDSIEASADGNECQWTYRNFYLSAQVGGRPLYSTRSRHQPGAAAGRVFGLSEPAFTGPRSASLRQDPAGSTPAPMRPSGTGGEPDVPPVTLAITFVDGAVARIVQNPSET